MKSTRWKRLAVQASLIALLLPAPSAFAQSISVQPGDTLGNLAYRYQRSVEQLKIANHLTTDMILAGQSLYIPPRSEVYTVKSGDVLWKIAVAHHTTIPALMEMNQRTSYDLLVGEKLLVPSAASDTPAVSSPAPDSQQPWVENNSYQVAKGDTPWTIAIEHGIPMTELLAVNKLSETDELQVGQSLVIPVHHIPKTSVKSAKYGEYLDWFKASQYLFPIHAVATVTDFETGRSFQVKRTIGAFHSDTEPLTAADTAIIKDIWGGTFSWDVRPVLVEVNGRQIAASMTSMPHSIEYITDNNFNGHFDIHFLNSLRHKDNVIDPRHQAAIKIAAGIQ